MPRFLRIKEAPLLKKGSQHGRKFSYSASLICIVSSLLTGKIPEFKVMAGRVGGPGAEPPDAGKFSKICKNIT